MVKEVMVNFCSICYFNNIYCCLKFVVRSLFCLCDQISEQEKNENVQSHFETLSDVKKDLTIRIVIAFFFARWNRVEMKMESQKYDAFKMCKMSKTKKLQISGTKGQTNFPTSSQSLQ